MNSECDTLPFKVYTLTKECYKCRQSTKILTYITFADNPIPLIFHLTKVHLKQLSETTL